MKAVYVYKNQSHIQTITYTFDLMRDNHHMSYIPKLGTKVGHTFFINIAFANMDHCRSQFFPDITKPSFYETCLNFPILFGTN